MLVLPTLNKRLLNKKKEKKKFTYRPVSLTPVKNGKIAIRRLLKAN